MYYWTRISPLPNLFFPIILIQLSRKFHVRIILYKEPAQQSIKRSTVKKKARFMPVGKHSNQNKSWQFLKQYIKN